MFEHHKEPVLSKVEYIARIVRHAWIAFGIVVASLGIGIIGYHELEGLSWIDSLVNASMLLGGMGPVGELHTTAGKLFASAYALFSGMVFLVVVAVLFAPAIHRFLHHFHLEIKDETSGDSSSDDE